MVEVEGSGVLPLRLPLSQLGGCGIRTRVPRLPAVDDGHRDHGRDDRGPGVETAKAVLGHSEISTTQIYAEVDSEAARSTRIERMILLAIALRRSLVGVR